MPFLQSSRRILDESGQALVELALILPAFSLILVGAIDVGRYAYQGIVVGNAAHAGAQYGSLNVTTAGDPAGMQAAALADAQGVAGASASAGSSCTCADGSSVSCAAPTACAGSHRLTFVSVTVTGSFLPVIRFVGIPTSLTITRQATMQVSP